jgi:beta-galactosidase/beta-glucuronidase
MNRDGQFLHNGKPILIKGVNRHDHNPRTGHYVTTEDIRADLLADEARQHQRRAHRPLSERSRLARTLR